MMIRKARRIISGAGGDAEGGVETRGGAGHAGEDGGEPLCDLLVDVGGADGEAFDEVGEGDEADEEEDDGLDDAVGGVDEVLVNLRLEYGPEGVVCGGEGGGGSRGDFLSACTISLSRLPAESLCSSVTTSLETPEAFELALGAGALRVAKSRAVLRAGGGRCRRDLWWRSQCRRDVYRRR